MTETTPETEGIAATPWTVGDLIKATLLSVIFIIIAAVVVVAGGIALRLVGFQADGTPAPLTIALVLVQNLAFVVSVWVFGLRKHKVGISRLGLRPFAAAAGCSYAAFALLLSFGFNVFYNLVTSGLDKTVQPTPVLPLFGGGLLGFGVALTIASGIVPFVEETFFRGFLFPGLARRFGFVAGVLISAVLFGAAHLNGDAFIPLSFFGVALALLYSATGSIYPSIVMHSVNNSIALLAAYLMQSGVVPGP